MSDLPLSANDVDYLLSPRAIRDQARALFARTEKGQGYFRYHADKFDSTVKYVLEVIRKNYPDLVIPFHSRWGHFRAGGVDRARILKSSLAEYDELERARIKLDLVITSVLLDAGAGAPWSFFEEGTKQSYNRSEGLGVASFHMFLSGIMSADGKSLRADAEGLKRVNAVDLRKYFQVSEKNPLVGVEGRVQLLNNLGTAVANSEIFPGKRPGNILDYLSRKYGKTIPASGLLRAVLDGLGVIWPGRITANGVNLGDVWKHSQLTGSATGALVPFHKLSQWMTYSLIEPIEEAGFAVNGVEELTGLAEYRNGGLLLDSGLFTLANPQDAEKAWSPDSDLIIEWRALTIYTLDRIGAEVQRALGKTPQDFPLAKVLEGGTWWAGRFLAKEKRANGDPPLKIQSDGTVF